MILDEFTIGLQILIEWILYTHCRFFLNKCAFSQYLKSIQKNEIWIITIDLHSFIFLFFIKTNFFKICKEKFWSFYHSNDKQILLQQLSLHLVFDKASRNQAFENIQITPTHFFLWWFRKTAIVYGDRKKTCSFFNYSSNLIFRIISGVKVPETKA